MSLNKHDRLYNIALRHKLRNSTFIDVLHFTVTVGLQQ
jgi:hypothetical protein